MSNFVRTCMLGLVSSLLVSIGSAGSASPPTGQKDDVLLSTMQQELERAQAALSKLDPAPYFLSYSVYDERQWNVFGTQGALLNSTHLRRRSAHVTVRIGSSELDNSHGTERKSAISSGALPIEDDPDAIAHELWHLTYEEYRKAANAYLKVTTSTRVRVHEEDTSRDFSQEKLQAHADYADIGSAPDQKLLEKMVRQYSAYFRQYPYILFSGVAINAQSTRFHFTSSEGSHVIVPKAIIRVTIQAITRAPDGMELVRVESFQAENMDHLAPEAEIVARVKKMASDLDALRNAPAAEPFDGPALLSGRAAAVFFHEVLGHRLESHRQRGEQEGQTFTKKVNQPILPSFLSVADDPTLRTLNGIDLTGWYEYDDEGQPATRVDAIKDGVLKGFLMSRMPVKGFGNSNGHGRAQSGFLPTGRQANLIVTSSRTIKNSELRKHLIEQVKRQHKAYGLYFEDIQGGFTLTQRSLPQAFEVLPVLVWRVYPDGRPDQLVRGVDIVGTPLAALSRIVVTGQATDVFNGMCGADSGFIPVAAAAPAILLSDIEVQRRANSLTRSPTLPRPQEPLPSPMPAPELPTVPPATPEKGSELP